jgi:NADH dehydrogenase
VLEPRHAVNPIRPMFGRTGPRFVEAEIVGVDLDRKVVHATLVHREPIEIEYDQLVLAMGGVTNTKIVPGSEHAMTFKTLADAIFLRNHVIERFEQADVEKDENRKRTLLTFVIVGAGLVGTELQGELSEFAHAVLKNYPNIDARSLRFELIEAGKRIMPELDEDLAQYATQVFRKRGINVRVNTPVAKIEPGKVTLPNDDVIETDTIMLAAGVLPSPLMEKIAIDKDRKGKAVVDGTMRVKGRPEVWALGDCASIPDPDGKPYPPLAQHAMREGRVLAKNLVAAKEGREPQPFVYKSLGTLAALGQFKGVGRVLRFKLKGFPAWFVWRSYYLMQMPRWSRRLRIMLDWTVALLFSYDVVELDLIHRESARRG